MRALRRTLSDEEAWLQNLLGPQWRGERTPFAQLLAQARWLRTLTALSPIGDVDALARICAAAPRASELGQALEGAIGALETVTNRLMITWPEGEEIPLETLSARLERMRARLDLYGEWARLSMLASGLIGDGLTPLLTALDDGTLRPEGAVDELLYAIGEARWEAARAALSELEGLAHLDRHALVAAFRDLEGARMEETQRLVRGKHLAQLPTGASGPMGFLRGEMAKKRRHRSIRQIMKAAGPMVQRIKPVFLMSPISIAQYLPPGTAEFDLLVIDEASQVRPEDALGAIARCHQIGPAPVSFRSFESDTRHQGDRIWQRYTATSLSGMRFALRSPVA